ncbi:MAG: sulfur carrier protein ThiS [Planctomycetes bacterium]|nr:sulfur carrier protein ThiS [Planctomycetota bacterium]
MSHELRLVVNGVEKKYSESDFPATISALIESMGLDGGLVVAELNGQIIKREQYPTATLANQDSIELVRFVGGG